MENQNQCIADAITKAFGCQEKQPAFIESIAMCLGMGAETLTTVPEALNNIATALNNIAIALSERR